MMKISVNGKFMDVTSLGKWDMIQDNFGHVFIVYDVNTDKKTVSVSSQKGTMCVLDFRDFKEEEFYYKCHVKMMFKNMI